MLWRHLQGQSWSAGLCVCTRDRTEPDDRAWSWRGGAVGVPWALGVPSSSGHCYPCLTAVRSPPGQGAERRQPLERCVMLLLLQSKERLLYESRRPGFLLPVLELHLNRKKNHTAYTVSYLTFFSVNIISVRFTDAAEFIIFPPTEGSPVSPPTHVLGQLDCERLPRSPPIPPGLVSCPVAPVRGPQAHSLGQRHGLAPWWPHSTMAPLPHGPQRDY